MVVKLLPFSKMNKKSGILLVAIVLLAFFLRLYKVTVIPPSLNWDEVSIGYNAYSVLKTGKDEWNQFLPLHFKSYGEYKLPAQIYASIPGIAIFGLNELGVRITPVIYGTATVLLTFFLARALFESEIVGLLAALLLGISPWHIHLTRASFESSFAVFWLVLGVWLFVKGFSRSKILITSMTALAVSVYTYNSARIFTPIFLLVVFLIYHKDLLKFRKALIATVILFFSLMLPLVPFVLSGEGSARYKLVSITDDPGLIPRINENRGNSTLPEPLPRLIHNKITYISLSFGKNYLAHFTPDFLFISGAPHKQHHVQNIGELYLFQAPFLIIGLFLLFRKRQKFRWLIISWLLLAFIPVATTNDSIPHALRTLIAVPTYQLISGYGIYQSYLILRARKEKLAWVFVFLMTLIVAASMVSYLNNYYNIYPKLYSRDWQYGNKQVVEFISKHQDEYDQIYYTRHYGEPHMFSLFFLSYDPYKFQSDPDLVRFETYNWIRVLRFDKYNFPDLGDPGTRFEDILKSNPIKKILFIGKPGDFPPEWHKLKTINFLDGNPAFEIVERK